MLQTCKDFYNNDISVLYEKNTFAFHANNAWYSITDVNDGSNYGTLLTRNNVEYRPARDFIKLNLWSEWNENEHLMKIAEAVHQIRMRRPVEMLYGWVYADSFLRFLLHIGDNAAKLKKLAFHGIVETHLCALADCHPVYHSNLVEKLKIYIPFIIAFCTKAEKLSIYAQEDKVHNKRPRPDGKGTQTTKDAVMPLLEKNLREIPTLKYLEVFKVRIVDDRSRDRHSQTSITSERLQYAIPSNEWFANRGNIASSETSLVENKENETERVVCGFCSEDHVRADYYNLCAFCGAYGHFKGSCSSLHILTEKQIAARHRSKLELERRRARNL